ncbi:hypothetical protein AMAG_05429 [Allomyces macrogynus ATCC 38327]|uniref:P/Homo B domain-containing protein n=1 Tax=Allomyces macrogynus (strain ATCC 38327) TaxID=578462 RepID=A0A0L0SBZ1_ALLM3|nr:hypothetical protein AMAG_05429 [Allomyces macrogynus ATCC 38327]|eukprot:KNE59986.1 hypothetical protein AMAG_05429 [Allomyces macrogynus ATCC 38327]
MRRRSTHFRLAGGGRSDDVVGPDHERHSPPPLAPLRRLGRGIARTIALIILAALFSTAAVAASSAPRTWAIELRDEHNTPAVADAIARRDGFVNLGRIGALPNHWLFEALDDDPARGDGTSARSTRAINNQLAARLRRTDAEYVWFQHQERRPRYRRGGDDIRVGTRGPVDPYSEYHAWNDPLLPRQWYLQAPPESTHVSLNVFPLWKAGLSGKGVQLAVIDDGVEGTHSDLQPNFDAANSWNFLSRTADVQPHDPIDQHGTRCAGEIASIPNNGRCGVGIAYNSRVSGLKVIGDVFPTDAEEAQAFTHALTVHQIFSSSWGPKDDGAHLDGPGALARAAMQRGVTTGRGGRGAVYVFAAGNGGRFNDNCNADGYANSPFTVAVGSLSSDGTLPWYSEPCAAHLVMGLGGTGTQLVATTDINGQCTDAHTGTSAAAPQVAALVALLLEARPDLSWRDVQHLLIRSTNVVDRADASWSPNRAGLMVSHKYAFGLVDGEKLLANARAWTRRPVPQLAAALPSDTTGYPVQLAGVPLVVRTQVTRAQVRVLRRIEHVTVTVRLRHPHRGALTITLYAPDRRSHSVLMTPRNQDNATSGFLDWTFSSVHHWDEDPVGTWELEIVDPRTPDGTRGQAGTLDEWKIAFTGGCADEDAVLKDDGSGDRTCIVPAGTGTMPGWLSLSPSDRSLATAGVVLGTLAILVVLVWVVRQWRARRRHYTTLQDPLPSKPTFHKRPGFGSMQLLMAEEGADTTSSPAASPKKLTDQISLKAMQVWKTATSPSSRASPASMSSPKKAFDAPKSPAIEVTLPSPFPGADTRRPTLTRSASHGNMLLGGGGSVRTSAGPRNPHHDPSATPFDLAPPVSFRDAPPPVAAASARPPSPRSPAEVGGPSTGGSRSTSPAGVRRVLSKPAGLNLGRVASMSLLDAGKDKGKYEQ